MSYGTRGLEHSPGLNGVKMVHKPRLRCLIQSIRLCPSVCSEVNDEFRGAYGGRERVGDRIRHMVSLSLVLRA